MFAKILFLFMFSLTALVAAPLKIVVSFSVLHDLVKQLTHGIEDVQIHTLIPFQTDPHCYEAKPSDLVALCEADIIFINGRTLEISLERMIDSHGLRSKTSVLSVNVPERPDLVDPHAWHHPLYMKQYVDACFTGILPHLAKSTHQKRLEENATALKKQLDDLHSWITQQFKGISNRIVLTTHDAFWFYGTAYGVEFVSPVGISTEAHPSPRKVAELIALIKSRKIRAILLETLSNPQQVQQIAQETNTPVQQETLYADSLSDPSGPAADYFSMMRHNTRIIAAALTS